MKLRALVLAMCLATLCPGPVLAQSPDSTQQQPTPPTAPRSPAPSTKPAPPPPPPAPGSPAPSIAIAPPLPPPPPAPRREGQPVNIKVDVTITDQRGGTQALKKTVTVVTGDSMGGFIRSTARYSNIGEVPLNVDTEPFILADGKMRVRVNLQYDLPASPSDTTSQVGVTGHLTKTQIHESLALILENGKPIIAAQSADPVGDRQVTIEVKATILR